MEREGRWSISACRCTPGMIHFTYGNATLHICIEDVANLVAALVETLQSTAANTEEANRSMH